MSSGGPSDHCDCHSWPHWLLFSLGLESLFWVGNVSGWGNSGGRRKPPNHNSFKLRLLLSVAYLTGGQEVAGSNPVAPTDDKSRNQNRLRLFVCAKRESW